MRVYEASQTSGVPQVLSNCQLSTYFQSMGHLSYTCIKYLYHEKARSLSYYVKCACSDWTAHMRSPVEACTVHPGWHFSLSDLHLVEFETADIKDVHLHMLNLHDQIGTKINYHRIILQSCWSYDNGKSRRSPKTEGS